MSAAVGALACVTLGQIAESGLIPIGGKVTGHLKKNEGERKKASEGNIHQIH